MIYFTKRYVLMAVHYIIIWYMMHLRCGPLVHVTNYSDMHFRIDALLQISTGSNTSE